MSVINEEDDPLIKNLIDEEFRNLEHAEKEKKCELEIKREEAKEKASALWKKLKAIEEQKAAEEKLKQQRMREEVEAQQKCEEDKIKAAKEYEMKLKQQLKEKYMKDMEKEKQRIEMQKIEQKYGPEILSQVHKDMGHHPVKFQALLSLLLHCLHPKVSLTWKLHLLHSLVKLSKRNIRELN